MLLLIAGCAESQKPSAEPAGKSVTLAVSGMSCVSCAATVTQTVESMAGVSDAEVNLAKQTLQVVYAPDLVSPGQIAAAVNEIGYGAEVPTETK